METKKTIQHADDLGSVPGGGDVSGAKAIDELFPVTGSDEDDLLGAISCGIKAMEYPKPPLDFVGSIMKAVESKRMPWWYRAYRWVKSPHSFTLTPLRTVPVAALLLVCMLSAAYMLGGKGTEQSQLAELREGIPVTFTLKMPEARSVQVVGSFSGWRPSKCEKCETPGNDEGTWTITVRLPEGRHEYAFLVDGTKVVPDPFSEFYQDDGFGNRNSILVVGNNHETAI